MADWLIDHRRVSLAGENESAGPCIRQRGRCAGGTAHEDIATRSASGQAALAAEAIAGLDADAAQLRWLEALAQSPDDPEILNGYATFLTDHARDAVDAEQFYRRALELNPSNSAIAANLARHLLAEGQSAIGLQQLSSTLSLILAERSPAPEVLAELMFYLLAHDRPRGAVALTTLKRLIRSGTRSPGWNFEPTIHRAQDEHHPEMALLRDTAKVLSHGADPALLDAHVAWRMA